MYTSGGRKLFVCFGVVFFSLMYKPLWGMFPIQDVARADESVSLSVTVTFKTSIKRIHIGQNASLRHFCSSATRADYRAVMLCVLGEKFEH